MITEPVEGGWCESCALSSVAAFIVEIVDAIANARHLLLCLVCRECHGGRSIPWV